MAGQKHAAHYSSIIHLRVHWGGYNERELRRKQRNQALDWVVCPLFGVFYLLLACLAARPGAAAARAAGDAPLPAGAPGQAAVRLLLAAVAAYVFVLHSRTQPTPAEGSEVFTVQSQIGRWCYLTRHALTMQMWHQLFTVGGLFSPWLGALTDGSALWVGALGWFVTIQFFALVVPNKSYKAECEMWAKRMIQFKEIGLVVHVPALLIAVLDVAVARSGEGLVQAYCLEHLLALLFGYVMFYLAVIFANMKATGCWPYTFMNDMGADPMKWASFVGAQTTILFTFFFFNWLIFWLKTA